MGLAMVQGFVKQSKGIVRIYSEQRHGTSIKMYFPAAEQNAQTPEFSDGGVPKETFPATVLLVEDQEGVRRVIEKTLSSAGYRVISTASGDEAIDVYQQRNDDIDVIVTDVVMPGTIQGPQFVTLARKINHNVPALYMSGYPHEANVHGNGIRAGDISLLKPVRRSDLLTAVARLLRQP
jgi:CheY-like chemotaxis protein